jgi:hypothetical protein
VDGGGEGGTYSRTQCIMPAHESVVFTRVDLGNKMICIRVAHGTPNDNLPKLLFSSEVSVALG